MEDINATRDVFKLGYEVAELTWEHGQLAMQELSSRRVPTTSQTTTSWDKPRAAETLEDIVDQATLHSYCKTKAAFDDEELVPWLHDLTPAVASGSINASASMTSDALVPSSNIRKEERSAQARRSIKSGRDAGCSTLVGSCSGNPSALMDTQAGCGTTANQTHDWSSYRDMTVSVSGNDTFGGDLGGRQLTSNSTESPESTSSGRECSNSKSTFPDDSLCQCRNQRKGSKGNSVREKKRGKAKASISNSRRRTAAVHNQSERKRRDRINQRMKTLQNMVPNSTKMDKASILDEVIEYIKTLQAQVHMMNVSPMLSLAIQQQQQQQRHMSMMNSMGMGMGGINMNNMGLSNIPTGFHPSSFMNMPSWNNQTSDSIVNNNTLAANLMSSFLASRSQPMNMDSYSRMAALYQHMQNQPSGPFPKK